MQPLEKETSEIGYPEDWDLIAQLVKSLAGWRCEHCGHPDDAAAGRVLTVHHLDGDKANCSWQNLVALCQRCHLSIQAKFDPHQIDLFGEYPDWQRRRGLCPHDKGPSPITAAVWASNINYSAQGYEFYCSGPADLVNIMISVQKRMLRWPKKSPETR